MLTAPIALPSEVFLDPWLGKVRDQGGEGSCTAQSTAGDVDFELRRYNPKFKGLPPEQIPSVSAQFIYNRSRFLDGTLGQDSGSTGRTTCKVLQQFGVCLESSWPYVQGDIFRDPTPEQLAEALKYKLDAYHFAYTVDDLKRGLGDSNPYPFRLGMAVYESFEEDTGGTTVYAPKHGESLLGYHEVLVKGYSDSKFGGAFSVRNSWGSKWGAHGDFWMPYEVMADRKVFSDAVVQHYGVWKVPIA